MKAINKRDTGYLSEDLVCEFYQQRGYSLSAQNLYLGRHGEIDLVMKSARRWVLIEVRSGKLQRSRNSQIISQRKLSRLRKLVGIWKYNHLKSFQKDEQVRVDLVVVYDGLTDLISNLFPSGTWKGHIFDFKGKKLVWLPGII